MSEVIDAVRLQGIKDSLLELEKRTGTPLRTEPRYDSSGCPIENFAPDNNKAGDRFKSCWSGGTVRYTSDTEYLIYSYDDSHWWCNLSNDLSNQYTSSIIEWLSSRAAT
jgi:hypothetical protein